jgi:hypothetical protein
MRCGANSSSELAGTNTMTGPGDDPLPAGPDESPAVRLGAGRRRGALLVVEELGLGLPPG